MAFNEKYIQRSEFPYKRVTDKGQEIRNVYYGEVMSIDDPTEGGRIKVKILGLDNETTATEELPDCYPMLPKFFHVYPEVGEVVRIYLEDIRYPKRGRFWMGSVISQPHKIRFDSIYTALSTTDIGVTLPEPAPNTYPDAVGVYPTKSEVAIVGRENTDMILRTGQVELRAGKHENDNVLKLNTENPSTVSLTFEQVEETEEYYSSALVLSNKIGLIAHEGEPKFKAARLEPEDRLRIFEQAHPMVRGDVLVAALDIMRRAIIAHIHGYSGIPADKTSIINDLEKINLEGMLQKNVVIN
jgi:hypothetical protein